MAYCEEIEELIIEESKKELPPLVTHAKNYPSLNQKDVKDTVAELIEKESIHARFHCHYNDLCTIVFYSKRTL